MPHVQISRARSLPAWPAHRPLRAWQSAALERVLEHDGDSFLASATPAAGKTTFGLRVAHALLQAGRVQRVVVAAPTTHIARQWAADAARYGIDLEPNRPNAEGAEPRDRHGIAVTYQTIAAGPQLHARQTARQPTLLIADEPHHMGDDATWGRTAVAAFGGSVFRLLLSGTPFRSDNTPIPWVSYDADGVSAADYAYTYTQALVDTVCRPVTFATYDGDMEWLSDGKRRRADFGVVLPAQEAARRLRTALDPAGDWIRHVLREADNRLERIRAGAHADAGGLVIAADKEHAAALADELEAVTERRPPVVTSDAPDASKRIAAFAAGSDERWLVSVLMVSEGVDIPRLRVGVYATPARTELFFRQVVGRFIRRTPEPRGTQMSFLFLPSDPTLKRLAAEIEEERNHALVLREALDEGLLDEPPDRTASEPGAAFEALASGAARRDDELLTTTLPGENLSLFGDPAPAASPALAAFGGPAASASKPTPPADEPAYRRRERLREERATLVAAVARRTGEQHRAIHARVNARSGAKSVGAASIAQLEKGNALLERELAK